MNDREQALASQFEVEADRYLRHNGIDVERYGMGKNVVKLLMSVLAMHAANHFMSGGSQQAQAKPKPAQQSTPNNQPFEKLHPRETAPVAGHKPGQFAKKPGSDQPAAQREVRPLKDPLANKPKPQQSPSDPAQQQGQPQPQKPPVQQPKDANTARIAEIWDVNTTVPPVIPATAPTQAPTLESFTADVLGKLKTQSGDGDIFANPAAKARKEKAELDRITQFDPSMFTEQEQPEAPSAPVTINDVGGDYVALEQARKDRQKLVTANRNWEIETQEDPEANTAEIASEYELDHEPFSKYVNEMQSFEQGEWKRRESVKTAIRKAWGVNSQDLSDMENRKGLDHSSLQGADQLKGSLDDSDIYEFLGSDEQEWAQNAWKMLREDQPPKPGAHSKDWLRTQAENFTRHKQMSGQSEQDYPEPEDGMPFSKKSLSAMIDRYFKQEELRFHGKKPQSSFSFWTVLDSWL